MKSKVNFKFSVVFEKSEMTGDMDKDTLEARISGLSFYVNMDEFTNYSLEGGYVTAEPDNVQDPNAIAIYHESGKKVGYISKECIPDVKNFTNGENAPCIIYIVPFMDKNGKGGLKGVVRIFRYYDGETGYVNSIGEHFIDFYALKLKEDLRELEEKLQKREPKSRLDSIDENHIKFKGVPINGTISEVRAKIINAGFEPDGEPLVGRFAGMEVKAYVGGNDEMDIAYSVIVVSEQETSWTSLKNRYLNVRDLYIRKYGDPINESQCFLDPYYEGDGDELEATEKTKCLYASKFSVPGGVVSINIINRSVFLVFEDTINKDIALENDSDDGELDDDYDAYNDI